MLKSKQVCEILHIHPNTLRRWANEGKIKYYRQSGGHRIYDLDSFLAADQEIETKTSYIYARVSSRKQKDDLGNQIKYLRERYPNHALIEDYGSGLNFKRKGLKRLLAEVMLGNVKEIVITHRDRLCRFGFDMFSFIAEQYDCQLVVLDQSAISPKEELVKDLISIIHVFSCRIYGLRTYADKIKANKSLSQ